MRKRMAAAALLVFGLAASAHAQEMTESQRAAYEQMLRNSGVDPQQMNAAMASARAAQQFGDVVRYRVVGVYAGRTNVSADSNWMAYADVTDRLEMQFDWQVSELKLLGTPSLQNSKSTLANPRNPEPKCAPPKVKGPFEYELKSIDQAIGGALRLHLQTSYPPVDVHQQCTGALKAIAQKQSLGQLEFMVPSPTMLSMQLPPNGDITLSSDRNSLVHKKGGWTWTFTPQPR